LKQKMKDLSSMLLIHIYIGQKSHMMLLDISF